eukprot:m.171480 g.171480  ORF g.171480 m.171480 type:complete len:956 (-) comp9936_c0_seq1:86-2953(-)
MARPRLPLSAIALVLLLAPSLSAFKPNYEWGHGFITLRAASQTGLKFCQSTLDALAHYNRHVDYSMEIFVNDAHCDDEHIPECTKRIMDLRFVAEAKFTEAGTYPEGSSQREGLAKEAYKALGRALHTLQDFYAHSNWVDMGRKSIHDGVGRAVVQPANFNVAFCGQDRSTLLPNLDGILTTGYFPISLNIPALCTKLIPVGKCRHGLSSFLADCPLGLNKDDSPEFGPVDNTQEARNFPMAQALAIAASKRFLLDVYADLASSSGGRAAYLGRCGVNLHYIIDTTGSMSDDIASVQGYIRTLTVNRPASAPTVARFGMTLFNDPSPPITSFYSDASSFLTALSLLTVSGGDDCPELLFGGILSASQADVNGAQLFVFTDADGKDAYLSATAAASVLSKSQTVKFLLPGSCTSRRRAVDVAITNFATVTGSTVLRTSPSTLGTALAIVDTSLQLDSATLFAIVTYTVYTPTASLCTGSPFLCYCSSVSFPASGLTRNFTFTVTFASASSPSLASTVGKPAGSQIVLSSNNAIMGASVYSIANLTPSQYTFTVCSNAGALPLTISGIARMPFSVKDFDFTVPMGRPGEETPVPIEGAPVTGTTLQLACRLQLFSPNTTRADMFSNINISLLSQDGTTRYASTAANASLSGDSLFLYVASRGTVIVPRLTFVVVVSGTFNQSDFQLQYGSPVVPQSLRIDYVSVKGEGNASSLFSTALPFANIPLRNSSVLQLNVSSQAISATTVSLIVQADNSSSTIPLTLLDYIAPSSINVPAGGSLLVPLTITPKSSVPAGARVTLTVSVSSAANPTLANYISIDVNFVGCSDCPVTIGTCVAMNTSSTAGNTTTVGNSYGCSCYFGINDTRCLPTNVSSIELATTQTSSDDALGPWWVWACIAVGGVLAVVVAILLIKRGIQSRNAGNPSGMMRGKAESAVGLQWIGDIRANPERKCTPSSRV